MSLGYGGAARLVLQDDETVIYEYFADNLNHPKYCNKNRIYDGIITISKSALVEPEIHRKVKRMPSGRKKLIEKRVPVEVNWSELYYSDLIQVQNSSYCWRILDNGWGVAALHIIWKIFDEYQETGTLPEITGWMC